MADIPAGTVDEIILVDDCSRDGTVALARPGWASPWSSTSTTLATAATRRPCYREALARGADVVVMIRDYHYDSRLVPHLVGLLRNGGTT